MMFAIYDSSGLVAELLANPRWVRLQANGVICGCPRGQADSIYSSDKDKFYPYSGAGGYYLSGEVTVPDGVESGYWHFRGGNFYQTDADKARKTADEAASKKIALLEAQKSALSDTCDRLEDCIVEMAGIVYA